MSIEKKSPSAVATESYLKYESFRDNLLRGPEFNFPDFGYYYVQHFPSTADALLSVFNPSCENEERIGSRYVSELSINPFWIKSTIFEILHEADRFGNHEVAFKALSTIRNDSRFASFYSSELEQGLMMTLADSLSSKTLWLLVEASQFSATLLITDPDKFRNDSKSWLSCLLLNCDDSEMRDIDFCISTLFMHTRNARARSFNHTHESPLDIIRRCRSSAIIDKYIKSMEWMRTMGYSHAQDSHSQLFYTRNRGLHREIPYQLDNYISKLVSEKRIKLKYFDSLPSIENYSAGQIKSLYAAGYRFSLSYTKHDYDNLLRQKKSKIIFAAYSQQCCDIYAHLDFETIYNRCFSDKISLKQAKNSLTGEISENEIEVLKMWEMSINAECASRLSEENNSFFKMMLVGAPMLISEFAGRAAKSYAGEAYTAIDSNTSMVAIAIWLSSILLLKEGKSATKALERYAGSRLPLIKEKLISFVSYSGGIGYKSINKVFSSLWELMGMVDHKDPDSAMDIEDMEELPQTRETIISIEWKAPLKKKPSVFGGQPDLDHF